MAATPEDIKRAKAAASKLFPSNINVGGNRPSSRPSKVTDVNTAKRNVGTLFPDATKLGPATPKPVPFELSDTKNLYEQQVEVVTATGGTRTLTFDGQTTSALDYNASAATIKSALEALSNVAVDDIGVEQTTGSPFTYRFGSAYLGEDVPQITVNSNFPLQGEGSVMETVTEGSYTNEVQTETVTATGGTRTLTFSGQTTSALAYDANAATIQAALEALSNVAAGDITVSGTGPYVYTFGGAYKGVNVPTMTVDTTSLTGGSSSIEVTISGVTAVNEVQRETVSATSGSRTLTFDGQTTEELPFDASAAEIQAALEALSNVEVGDIVVTGVYRNAFTFKGAFKNQNVPTMTVSTGSLTSGTSTITVTSASMEEIIAREKTQAALASYGLARPQSLASNDAEMFNRRKPKDIGEAGRIPGEDYGLIS